MQLVEPSLISRIFTGNFMLFKFGLLFQIGELEKMSYFDNLCVYLLI